MQGDLLREDPGKHSILCQLIGKRKLPSNTGIINFEVNAVGDRKQTANNTPTTRTSRVARDGQTFFLINMNIATCLSEKKKPQGKCFS